MAAPRMFAPVCPLEKLLENVISPKLPDDSYATRVRFGLDVESGLGSSCMKRPLHGVRPSQNNGGFGQTGVKIAACRNPVLCTFRSGIQNRKDDQPCLGLKLVSFLLEGSHPIEQLGPLDIDPLRQRHKVQNGVYVVSNKLVFPHETGHPIDDWPEHFHPIRTGFGNDKEVCAPIQLGKQEIELLHQLG